MFFIVVEEVGKKQGYKLLDMFSGENATCSECPSRRKKWEGNNPEKVREFSRRYAEEHKEEKEVHNVINNAIAGK